MFIDYSPEVVEVEYVLNNLSYLTKKELSLSFGKDYKDKVINILVLSKCLYLIKLKKDSTPVAIFGLIEENAQSAGIFFLSTDEMYQGNMIQLIRESKKVIDNWLKTYKVLLDDCHKENIKIQKWLKYLGFSASGEIKSDNFEVYYKGELNYAK